MLTEMSAASRFDEMTVVPRAAISLPLAFPPPPGFRADDVGTWPPVEGRLEYLDGELLYMPPCAEHQQLTAADVTRTLMNWASQHPEFMVGSNEAGMMFGRDVRAGDAVVYRESDLAVRNEGLIRAIPVLVVEISGRDEPIDYLRSKAQWYIDRGVAVVWLISPQDRTVHVVTQGSEERYQVGEQLSAHAELPSLTPTVDELTEQVARRARR